jgi:hypothetical protein
MSRGLAAMAQVTLEESRRDADHDLLAERVVDVAEHGAPCPRISGLEGRVQPPLPDAAAEIDEAVVTRADEPEPAMPTGQPR